jgi:hypothetical protein
MPFQEYFEELEQISQFKIKGRFKLEKIIQ